MDIELFIPIICVYTVSRFFPISHIHLGTDNIRFDPPKWVYPIVWSILLLLLGYSWTLHSHKMFTYYYHALLTLLLCIWLIVHTHRNKKIPFMVILMSIYLTKYIIYKHYPHNSSYALSPLILWLWYASYLNYGFI